MDNDDRYRRGAEARRRILGNAWVDRADAEKNAFNAEWQDFITRCAWGEVWTRPHFDDRTRRVLVIGTMMAIGRWEEFRMHVRAALAEGGFTGEDIKEIILQQAVYCGCSRRRAIRSDVAGSSWCSTALPIIARVSTTNSLARSPDQRLKPACRRGHGRPAPALLHQAVSPRRRQ
jgi:4-carboxymuconolactone decarboxylase